MAKKEAIVLEMREADEEKSDPTALETNLLANNAYHRAVLKLQTKAASFWNLNGVLAKKITIAVLVALYFVYFGFAISYRFGDEGSWRLLGITVFAVFLATLVTVWPKFSAKENIWWEKTRNLRRTRVYLYFGTIAKWLLPVGLVLIIALYVIIDVAIDHPQNLVSVVGLVLYILIFYVTSISPVKVNWHTVFWGIALQYIFALLVLRTYWGFALFAWAGARVEEFLKHTVAGIVFVFGEASVDHYFAMRVMPIIPFFFAFTNIMYYLGAMQAIVRVLGRFLAYCLGTTPAESVSTAANIFLSMIDSPIIIKPFLSDMTRSELHAVMTGGFATMAGSALAIYTSFGVPANHLIAASVMSAPAALAISKLSYPETEESLGSDKDFDTLQKSPEHNIVEAVTNGATASIKVISSVVVNIIAFLSLLAFINATLTWFGERVGVENLTLEFICSYLFYPTSFFMGTDTADCRKVAELIGVKTFTNEFIAYTQLKDLIANRYTLTNYTTFYNTTEWYWKNDDIFLDITGQVLKGGILSVKSEVIATYALCGFANFGSIGITIGAVGALVPNKKSDLVKMVVRAMICGNVACFLTACVAGLLFKEYD